MNRRRLSCLFRSDGAQRHHCGRSVHATSTLFFFLNKKKKLFPVASVRWPAEIPVGKSSRSDSLLVSVHTHAHTHFFYSKSWIRGCFVYRVGLQWLDPHDAVLGGTCLTRSIVKTLCCSVSPPFFYLPVFLYLLSLPADSLYD